ncbi:hypothetical protein BG004_004967 [Podila humilis]|nr:hypothetical protein BG004_004967 [Podila humilis]
MVRISLAILSLAAVVSSFVAAAPCGQTPFENFDSLYQGDNKCVTYTQVKEYHPFYLKSENLDSLVSKQLDKNLVVGGHSGDKSLQELHLCIVSTELDCSTTIPSHCIYENVEYRFRVNAPVKGYLQVVDGQVKIVEHFAEATGLNLLRVDDGWRLRVTHLKSDGQHEVFSATGGNDPITLEPVVINKSSQWFLIDEHHSTRSSFDSLW